MSKTVTEETIAPTLPSHIIIKNEVNEWLADNSNQYINVKYFKTKKTISINFKYVIGSAESKDLKTISNTFNLILPINYPTERNTFKCDYSTTKASDILAKLTNYINTNIEGKRLAIKQLLTYINKHIGTIIEFEKKEWAIKKAVDVDAANDAEVEITDVDETRADTDVVSDGVVDESRVDTTQVQDANANSEIIDKSDVQDADDNNDTTNIQVANPIVAKTTIVNQDPIITKTLVQEIREAPLFTLIQSKQEQKDELMREFTSASLHQVPSTVPVEQTKEEHVQVHSSPVQQVQDEPSHVSQAQDEPSQVQPPPLAQPLPFDLGQLFYLRLKLLSSLKSPTLLASFKFKQVVTAIKSKQHQYAKAFNQVINSIKSDHVQITIKHNSTKTTLHLSNALIAKNPVIITNKINATLHQHSQN
ncbi:Hypothetical protein MVR_LOCUS154 [uncultured virus]|nr:Hypothetical protein MVR_LOCUS154 [uncultured virus]